MASKKAKAGAEPQKKSRLWLPIGIATAIALSSASLWYAGKLAWSARQIVFAKVSAQPENRLSSGAIRITPPPEWVDEDPIKAALVRSGLSEGVSLLEPDLVQRLANGFEESPWVSSVSAVKGHRAVRVTLDYRMPVLSVPLYRYNCYVDADGVALPPPNPAEPPEQYRQCLWVERATSFAAPAIGQRVDDPQIRRAARLAEMLMPYKSDFGIVAIVVVSESEGMLQCNLRTRLGSQIVLGEITDSYAAADLQAGMDALRPWLERYGSLDAPDGPYQFDVRQGRLAEPAPLVALRR